MNEQIDLEEAIAAAEGKTKTAVDVGLEWNAKHDAPILRCTTDLKRPRDLSADLDEDGKKIDGTGGLYKAVNGEDAIRDLISGLLGIFSRYF